MVGIASSADFALGGTPSQAAELESADDGRDADSAWVSARRLNSDERNALIRIDRLSFVRVKFIRPT